MFSVIIPTMWKSVRIWSMLHRLHHSDFVDEIIVIDNAKEDRPNSQFYSKVRLIEQEENIFVNPAWNLGVKECKNENICILNDDVTFNVDEVFNVANLVLKDHPTSCLGVHPISYKGYNETPKVAEGSAIGQGWGCCIFLKKENWVDIPEQIKIWFGDNWIVQNHEKSFSIAFKISTEMSTTSNLEELSNVIKQDVEQWNKFTDTIKPYKFVHIPKTGGTSMSLALKRFNHIRSIGFDTKKYIERNGDHQVYERSSTDPFSFCIVRNPFSRTVSAYNYLKSGGSNSLDLKDGIEFCNYEDFSSFVINGLEVAAKNQIHFLPQVSFIPNGVDLIGRVEEMEDLIKELESKLIERELKIPHANKGLSVNYKDYYKSDKVINKVVEIYAEDFDAFAYDKII